MSCGSGDRRGSWWCNSGDWCGLCVVVDGSLSQWLMGLMVDCGGVGLVLILDFDFAMDFGF